VRRVWERFRNLAPRDDLFLLVVYAPLFLMGSLSMVASGAWPNGALSHSLMLSGISCFGLSILASAVRLRHGRGRSNRGRTELRSGPLPAILRPHMKEIS